MIVNDALIDYLVEFHATRDFFECHEIMEEYWKSKGKDEYAQLWLAFIQVAVAQYHDRRGNKVGAAKMYESALLKFDMYKSDITEINMHNICDQIRNRLLYIDGFYDDFNFEIVDEALLSVCIQQAQSSKLQWKISSKLVDSEIINRHLTRNRSDVIEDRKAALQAKQNRRSHLN